MKRPPQPYIYFEYGYSFIALHRKALIYDPRITNNPIIDDYLETYKKNNNIKPIYHTVLENEIEKIRGAELPELPLSFKMLLQEINMAWVSLIHQMLFIDKAYDTFYGEFKDTIENIILYDSPDMKESLIYRNYISGDSIFHMAAKIWIFNQFYNIKDQLNTQQKLDKTLKYVLECYTELEKRMDSKFCIVYMTDFSGNRLLDFLLNFIENFKVEDID